jgi:signal transduction histidine kinase
VSSGEHARQLAFDAAEHRALERLRAVGPERSTRRRAVVIALAAALFAAIFAARLAVDDPDALIANFYVIPVAMVGIELGVAAGFVSAAVAVGLVFAWGAERSIDISPLGYVSRGAVVLITGVLAGWFSARLRQDVDRRRRAQRDLALYAEQLEGANGRLTSSVQRLEAFATIARAVGGEIGLDRVLALICEHGAEVVGARRLVVYLADGDQLVAIGGVTAGQPGQHVAPAGGLATEVLEHQRPVRLDAGDPRLLGDPLTVAARTAILVPLVFQGNGLGVLAAIDRRDGQSFGADGAQLLESVAASTATAVATARSVASEHLRLTLAAGEEARARWARELHDQTLQGLSGVRMVLGAALGRDDPAALRRAAEAADEFLGAETRGLRDLISELRPAALDDLGLGPAIESLVNRQAAAGGFAVELQVALTDQARPRELEIATYRIIQEALGNVVRHARAGRVHVGVDQRPDGVDLSVADDGQGFEPDRRPEGFGLAGMQERARLLGGALTVDSRGGGPTTVSAWLPAAGPILSSDPRRPLTPAGPAAASGLPPWTS